MNLTRAGFLRSLLALPFVAKALSNPFVVDSNAPSKVVPVKPNQPEPRVSDTGRLYQMSGFFHTGWSRTLQSSGLPESRDASV